MSDTTVELLLDDATTNIGKAYRILKKRKEAGTEYVLARIFAWQEFVGPCLQLLDESNVRTVSSIIAAITFEFKSEFGKVEHFLRLLCKHVDWVKLPTHFRSACVLGLLRGVTKEETHSVWLDSELLNLLLELSWSAPEGTPMGSDMRGDLSNLVALYSRQAGEVRRAAIGKFLMAVSERLKLTKGIYPSSFAEAVSNEFYYKWDNASPLYERFDRVGRLLVKES